MLQLHLLLPRRHGAVITGSAKFCLGAAEDDTTS
jgi:hypothetical protein